MNTLITNIGQLVTPRGRGALAGRGMSAIEVEERVEILISGPRIASIGRGHLRDGIDAIIDADGGVVLPGLVDPHTHALFPPGVRDDGPFVETIVEKRLRRGVDRALKTGTTTIEVKCSRGGEPEEEVSLLRRIERLKRSVPIRLVTTFLGALGRCGRCPREERVSSLIREVITAIRGLRLAEFCDVACGEGAYTEGETRTILRAARGAGLRAKIHAGEGERAVGSLGAELEVTTVDHLSSPTDRDIEGMRRTGVVPVLLPGAAFFRDRPYPDARRLIDSGLPIALGSDCGLAGYGVGSMWSVISIARLRLGMSLEEGISAVTLNGAAAVDLAGEIGSIEPGKLADLVILDIDDYREIGDLIGVSPVKKVLLEGSEAELG
ncbi:MAG TPA: hypothetical protein ENJ47_00985 [Candidatus Acetothermia bacterium]|nr:hypothetical protein [Candidatus Acetothermia bacterium]